ncbi:CDP-diacylglycerol--glycerol-3-phosphate 3-phosphatidyltransferase [bacterium]|jgi:CDP-diacylglycerol--glycerol-3-phosphate 3-phosphatidyltransferase|nr:CDP-diacylglycerol--glycerol-3-phosphate 3-phosphatidyltransferase [bacterium]
MSGDPEPFDQMTFHTTPNYLTLLRVLMVPAVILSLFQGSPAWDFGAAVFFGIAGLTDYLDGYLARKHKIETVYGKLMDPLADKFLVICSLIMLQHLGRMSPVVVMILVCRELTITGLRALASAEGVIMGASPGGKWKTVIQMIAIPCLMLREGFGIPFYTIGLWLTYLSLAFSLWSAKDYIVDFFRGLNVANALRKERRLQKKLARQRKQEARLKAALTRGSSSR